MDRRGALLATLVVTPDAGVALLPSGTTVIRTSPYALLALLVAASPAAADSITLANGFNVLVRNDMTLKADVGGRAAVGGNATFSNFAIGSGDNASNGASLATDPARYDLVVGGHAQLNNGSVNKGSAYAGSASTSSVGYHAAGASLQTGGLAPVDFVNLFTSAESLSQELLGFTGNGTANAQWGGLTLTGSDASLNVFDLTTSMLTGIHSLNILVPTTSTVLFNVSGSALTMQYMGINVNGAQDNTMSRQILWNFQNLSALTLNGLGWRGSILAPYATMSLANGNVNGQVIVNNLYTSWGGEYHNFGFDGELPFYDEEQPIPVDPTPAPVPEPSSMLLLGSAAAACAYRFRRSASALFRRSDAA